jgi:DNA-binding CsgD family transcriptional regulator
MLADPVAERARRTVARLCRRGMDAPSLLSAVAEAVRPVVGYDGAFWATTDPATVLVTGAYVEDLPRETAPFFYENEYLHDDVNKFSRLARGVRPVGTMSEATAGELARSRLHREVGRVSGLLGDNLKAAFVAGGFCWGVCGMARADPGLLFTQADVSFVASICGQVGEGLRAAILLDALAAPPGADRDAPPGLVILEGQRVRSASPSAAALLDELGGFGGASGDRLPSAVSAVAAATDRTGEDQMPAESARAVLRTRAGRWLELHGVRLESASGRSEVAVILEPARRPQLAALVMRAYGLSPREREVAQLVVAGASTAEASAALHISPYTLQDHLKSIFEKVGVRSRGELTARIFDRHYKPAQPFARRPPPVRARGGE